MKRLNAILSITVVILLITGSVAVAQEAEKPGKDAGPRLLGMRGRGPGRMMGRGAQMRGMGRGQRGGRPGMPGLLQLADKLELSESQREELSEIFTSHRKNNIRRKAEIELARVDLQKLTRQEEPNLDEVEVQLKKIADLQVEAKLSQIKVRVDSRNVLTEEQKTALKKLRQDQQAKRKAAAEPRNVGRPRMRRGQGPRE